MAALAARRTEDWKPIMSTSTGTLDDLGRPTLLGMSTKTLGIVLGMTAAAIWGAYLVLARSGVNAGLTASDIAFFRYGTAGLIMLPWLLMHRPATVAGVGRGRAAVLAALAGPLFVFASVGGYMFAPLAHGAILQPSGLTIGALVLAALVLKDRPGPGRIMGVAVILGGLVVIAGPGVLAGTALTPVGDLMFLAAGLMWAVFTVLTKRWELSPLQATAAVSVVSAAVYVPGYLVLEGIDRILAADPAMIVAQFVVQGVLSGVVAVLAFSKAVHLLGAGRASVFPAMVPAVAIVLGIPVTGEIPTQLHIAGLALVSVGLLLAVGAIRIPRRRARPT